MTMMQTTIQGIPCQVKATHIHTTPPNFSCTDSDWDYYGYDEVEFEVYDRKGYKAAWLERKMDDSDVKRISAELVEFNS